MQRIYPMTTTVSVLPEDLLVAAYTHETQEKERYRVLALRFLPFDAVTCRLLQMLADECEQRLEALQCVAKRLDYDELSCKLAEDGSTGKECHFFILNERMAAQLLVRTLVDEHRSLAFYRQLADSNTTPQLHKLLSSVMHQKQVQIRVLQELQELEPVSELRHIA